MYAWWFTWNFTFRCWTSTGWTVNIMWSAETRTYAIYSIESRVLSNAQTMYYNIVLLWLAQLLLLQMLRIKVKQYDGNYGGTPRTPQRIKIKYRNYWADRVLLRESQSVTHAIVTDGIIDRYTRIIIIIYVRFEHYYIITPWLYTAVAAWTFFLLWITCNIFTPAPTQKY